MSSSSRTYDVHQDIQELDDDTVEVYIDFSSVMPVDADQSDVKAWYGEDSGMLKVQYDGFEGAGTYTENVYDCLEEQNGFDRTAAYLESSRTYLNNGILTVSFDKEEQ